MGRYIFLTYLYDNYTFSVLPVRFIFFCRDEKGDSLISSFCRAVDPDPHGSAFIFPPRSVSRKKQKKCYVKDIGDNWHLIPFFTVILDQLHGFYTFELFLLSFSTLENSS